MQGTTKQKAKSNAKPEATAIAKAKVEVHRLEVQRQELQRFELTRLQVM